jgi:hypothetical protein
MIQKTKEAKAANEYPDKAREVFDRGAAGDASALELKLLFDTYPELASHVGNLVTQAENALVSLVGDWRQMPRQS